MKRLWPIREGLDSRTLVVAGSDWAVIPSLNPWLTIEVGKEADLIVIDRDPLTVPIGQVHAAQVLETWIGGERVYRRP